MIIVEDNNIFITKGDSAELALELQSGSESYDYSSDDVKFGIKRAATDQAVLLEKTFEDGKITFEPDDYDKLPGYGDFIYAVRVYHTNDDESVDVYTPIVARFTLGYNVL